MLRPHSGKVSRIRNNSESNSVHNSCDGPRPWTTTGVRGGRPAWSAGSDRQNRPWKTQSTSSTLTMDYSPVSNNGLGQQEKRGSKTVVSRRTNARRGLNNDSSSAPHSILKQIISANQPASVDGLSHADGEHGTNRLNANGKLQDSNLPKTEETVRNSENRRISETVSIQSESSEEESYTPGHPQLNPWEQFERHLKTIDDSANCHVKKEKITFRSSPTFKQIMDEVKTGKFEKSDTFKAMGVRFKSRLLSKKDISAAEGSDQEEEVNDGLQRRKSVMGLASKLGWSKIKRNVQEVQMERRKSETLGWMFLRQTLSHMTDLDRARQDLYSRYLDNKPQSEIERVKNSCPRLLSPDFDERVSQANCGRRPSSPMYVKKKTVRRKKSKRGKLRHLESSIFDRIPDDDDSVDTEPL